MSSRSPHIATLFLFSAYTLDHQACYSASKVAIRSTVTSCCVFSLVVGWLKQAGNSFYTHPRAASTKDKLVVVDIIIESFAAY